MYAIYIYMIDMLYVYYRFYALSQASAQSVAQVGELLREELLALKDARVK